MKVQGLILHVPAGVYAYVRSWSWSRWR